MAMQYSRLGLYVKREKKERVIRDSGKKKKVDYVNIILIVLLIIVVLVFILAR